MDSAAPHQPPSRALPAGPNLELRRPPSIWLALAAVAGIAGSLLAAGLLAALAWWTLREDGPAAALAPGIQFTSLLAVGLLGLPMLYWTLRGERRPTRRIGGWLGPLAGALFVLGLTLGSRAFSGGQPPWVLGSIAHLIAAAAPVVATASVALRAGPLLSRRRSWGHFLGGLWAAPPITLLLELVALIPAVLAIVFGLSLSESGLLALEQLAAVEPAGSAELTSVLVSLIRQPVVLLVATVFLAAVVPLLEEAIKSVSIWPLIPRRLSAGEAFLGGALCGSGYALFESLLLAQPGQDWLPSMVARAGTPFIHAFGTGLVSWGLVEAFTNRRPLRLLGLYLAAVALHGMWNLTAVAVGVSGISQEPGVGLLSPSWAASIAAAGGLVLIALAIASLVGLMLVPGRLLAAAAQSEAAARPRRM